MIQERVKIVYIALDQDAKKDAIKLAEYLLSYGITPFSVNLQDKDPSELGFKKFWHLADGIKPSTFSERIRGRLYG